MSPRTTTRHLARIALAVALALAIPAAAFPQAETATPGPTPTPTPSQGEPKPSAPEATLATPPVLKVLVPADLPPGTTFPAPAVDVFLGIDVAATGQVEAVRVEQGVGEPFDAAAREAARKFLFEPGRLSSGEPVPVTVTFKFTITAPPLPSPEAAPPPAPVRFGGRLLERGTRRPLPDAAVSIRTEGATVRTSTGADGRFSAEVPAGTFTVVAAPAGHVRLEAPVEARPGEEREETYYLERTGTGFETVIRAEPVRREITRQVLPAEEVAKLPGSQGDTIKAVLNLPGAARPPGLSGEVILRGSTPGDSRYFVEGQEIPILYHFGALRSTVNPRFLDSVEFIPGNFAPDYGRATGGIIEVKLRDPASDMFRGDATFSLYDAGASVEGPLGGGWSGGAAFHRSWIDTLLPLVIPKDANLSFDSAPRYYDYQFLAARKLGDQALRLLWYGSLDKVVIILKRPAEDPTISGTLSALTMFHALQGRLAGEVAPGLKQETSLQLTLTQFRFQFGPIYYFDLKGLTAALRSAWTLDLAPGLQARAGVDAAAGGVDIGLNTPTPPKEGEVDSPVSTRPTIALSQRSTEQQPAAFAELRWEPLRGLAVLPGVRVDWYSQIRRATVDPRLGVRWETWPGTTFKAGVGLFQQPPQPDESATRVGNPHLEAPRAVHWSAGAEHKVFDGVDAELTGFYKTLSRLVVRNPTSSFDPGAVPYVNEGTGRVYGLEATVKAKLGNRFFGFLAYTHQRAFRRDGFGKPERRFDFDQPHILTAVGTWTINNAWSAGARFRFVSGNPSTPVTGSVFDSTSGTFVPTYGATNSSRLPAFTELDLRVDRTWTYRTWKLTLFLDVQNVTNRGNVEGYRYNYDYTQKTPETGLPLIPILGLDAEW